MSPLEWIAVLLTVAGVWLTARQHLLCWPVGLASVALYAWIFFAAKLYSDALLQACFLVLQLYGWWAWLQNPAQHTGQRPVVRAGIAQLAALFSAGALVPPPGAG
ncbi:MAG: nicotinamide riboside transporter PnuC [Kiritimatiellia bacterium]